MSSMGALDWRVNGTIERTGAPAAERRRTIGDLRFGIALAFLVWVSILVPAFLFLS